MRLSTMLAMGTLLASALTTHQVYAHSANNEQQYNMVALQASASRQVSNDEMSAVLSIEKSHKAPNELANQVNQALNFAKTTAKKYPSVQFKTGTQNTYPIYDNNNRKLKEWRNESSVVLESQDFEAMSKLIAELQSQFQLEDMSFSVSEQQRKKVEDELLVEVSKNFQSRASILRQAWNKAGYDLVNFNVDFQHNYHAVAMPTAAMASDAREQRAKSVAVQDVSAGESKITVNAHGNIQLK